MFLLTIKLPTHDMDRGMDYKGKGPAKRENSGEYGAIGQERAAMRAASGGLGESPGG